MREIRLIGVEFDAVVIKFPPLLLEALGGTFSCLQCSREKTREKGSCGYTCHNIYLHYAAQFSQTAT